MSYIDTPDKRKRIQKALSEHLDPTGHPYYSGDIDGIFGEQSVLAITNFRHDRNIVYPPHPASIDTDIMRELGLLTIQDPVVVGAAAMKGIDLLSLLKLFGLANSLLKGNTTMTADQITGVLRALIAALSGFLIAKGVGNADFWTWISAGVTAIIPVVWTWISNRPKTIVPLAQK